MGFSGVKRTHSSKLWPAVLLVHLSNEAQNRVVRGLGAVVALGANDARQFGVFAQRDVEGQGSKFLRDRTLVLVFNLVFVFITLRVFTLVFVTHHRTGALGVASLPNGIGEDLIQPDDLRNQFEIRV